MAKKCRVCTYGKDCFDVKCAKELQQGKILEESEKIIADNLEKPMSFWGGKTKGAKKR